MNRRDIEGSVMENTLNTIGTLSLYTTLVVIMLSMGLQITTREILAAVRRRRLVATVLLVNLIVLPLVALGLSRLAAMPEAIAAGFIILAVAPGSSLSPKLSEIARADLSLAVGLMFVMALLSVVATPLMAGLLLPDSPTLQFDPLNVVGILILFQLLPLLIGLAVHHWRPAFARRLRQPSIRLSNILFFLVVAFYAIRDFEALRALPLPTVAAMVLMTLISLVAGWHAGGSNRASRQSLAMATGSEFSGLALLIVTLNFPGTSAGVAVVAFGLIMIFINTALAFYWGRRRAVRARGEVKGAMKAVPPA